MILKASVVNEGMGDALVVDIVKALEEQGLSRYAYQLHDFVDPDALERVIDSMGGEFSMTLSIEGMDLEITDDGVEALPPADETAATPTDSIDRPDIDAVNTIIEFLSVETRKELYEEAVAFLHRKIDANMTKVAVARDGLLVPVASTNGGNTGERHAIPIDTTIPGSVFRSGAGCNIGNIHEVRGTEVPPKPSASSPEDRGVEHRSMVCAPVGDLGIILGLRREPNSFDDDDLAMTAAIGRLLALVTPMIEDVTEE